jgi:hypothetical protein
MTPEEHERQQRLTSFVNARSNLKQNEALTEQNKELIRQGQNIERQTESILRQEQQAAEEKEWQNVLFKIKTEFERWYSELPLQDPMPSAVKLVDKPYEPYLDPSRYSSLEWKNVAIQTARLIEEFRKSFDLHHTGVIKIMLSERVAVAEAKRKEEERARQEALAQAQREEAERSRLNDLATLASIQTRKKIFSAAKDYFLIASLIGIPPVTLLLNSSKINITQWLCAAWLVVLVAYLISRAKK